MPLVVKLLHPERGRVYGKSCLKNNSVRSTVVVEWEMNGFIEVIISHSLCFAFGRTL